MLFLIKKDFHYIISKRKSWILLYFAIMIAFPIFCKWNQYRNEDLFLIHTGLKFDDASFLFIILYLFHFAFYLFICLDIIIGNLKIGVDNVFLRMNKIKIVISKCCSCFFFLTVNFGILFFILLWEYQLFSFPINYLFENYIISIFSKMIIVMVSILLITACLSKRGLPTLLLIFVVFILTHTYIYYLQPYLFHNKIVELILSFIFVLSEYLFVLKKTIITLFERSF